MEYVPVISCICVWMCMCVIRLFWLDLFFHLLQRGDYTIMSASFTFLSQYTSHLIVQIEVVELSIGPEVLSVSVQGKVDISAVAFDHR